MPHLLMRKHHDNIEPGRAHILCLSLLPGTRRRRREYRIIKESSGSDEKHIRTQMLVATMVDVVAVGGGRSRRRR